jgi:hypothetical protein
MSPIVGEIVASNSSTLEGGAELILNDIIRALDDDSSDPLLALFHPTNRAGQLDHKVPHHRDLEGVKARCSLSTSRESGARFPPRQEH